MSSPHGHRMKWCESTGCGCKINLRLKVTGRRPDGMHDLSSCFLFFAEPGDVLTVAGEQESMTLECPGFPDLANEKNLVWRAAEAFAAAAGIVPQWKIVLEKKVPLAAGLGGGSADAGALLKVLNGRYQIFDDRQLSEIGFSLGADVPFFLHRRAAWITGAGENCRMLEKLPPIPHILIVNPGFPVSAKWAYTHLSPELIGPDDPEMEKAFVSGRCSWRQFCINDLAPAVFRKFPLLEMLRDELYCNGAQLVQMSGSGPSLFALFEENAEECAGKIREKFAGMDGLRVFCPPAVQFLEKE